MKRRITVLSLFLIFAAALFVCAAPARPAQAAVKTARWVKKSGKWRYRQKNGTYAKKKFLKIGKKYYYFSKKGNVYRGWFTVKGYKYYGTKSTVAGTAGKLKGGWVYTKAHKMYYFSKKSGAGKYGRMLTGWRSIGGRYFYFNEKGVMLTGWQTIGGKTFYFEPTGGKGVMGSLYTGWQTVDGERYLFAEEGSYGTLGAVYKDQWGPKGGTTRVHFDANGKIDRESMSKTEFVEYIGTLAHEDMIKSGVLASVTAAQAILESGYGMSVLALDAKNLFGIKAPSTGVSNWKGSTWTGEKYGIMTGEYLNGKDVMIYDYFCAYNSWEESIADHSAYLANKTYGNTTKLRYAGVVGCTSPKKSFQIIKNGGYATDPDYVTSLCKVVDRWDLTKYDKMTAAEKAAMKANIEAAK